MLLPFLMEILKTFADGPVFLNVFGENIWSNCLLLLAAVYLLMSFCICLFVCLSVFLSVCLSLPLHEGLELVRAVSVLSHKRLWSVLRFSIDWSINSLIDDWLADWRIWLTDCLIFQLTDWSMVMMIAGVDWCVQGLTAWPESALTNVETDSTFSLIFLWLYSH